MASDTDDAYSDSYARLERAVGVDPLRVFDRLGRNQPRRLGCMELIARPLPWMLAAFTGTVPDNFIAQIGDGEVEVPCPCKAATTIPYNIATPCEGNCGRWFWYFAGWVRVAYLSAEEQDDGDQAEREQGGGADKADGGPVLD
jgi:hypothetical protein